MLKRWCIGIILALFYVGGCTKHTIILKTPVVPKVQRLPRFDQIQVNGPINVNLATGYSQSTLSLKGNALNLLNVQAEVVGNRLLISFPKNQNARGIITATIHTSRLNSFIYDGAGTIIGKNLNSNDLSLYIKNPGKTILGGRLDINHFEVSGGGSVNISGLRSPGLELFIKEKTRVKLSGVAILNKINLSDTSCLSLYWVKSNALTIRASDRAYIQLAGSVDKLDLELYGAARFNGRYLRVRRAFVKTFNTSTAEIAAVQHQHALASDASNIYYYTVPHMRTDFMAFDGSVLDMREWDPFNNENYTRYNK